MIPFPFQVSFAAQIRTFFISFLQDNINALDIEDQLVCLHGLVDAHAEAQHAKSKPANFEEWLLRVRVLIAARH